ncbi:MAG: S8 family serine peptidase, partial [Candidatus Bathyarchaeia archaeon]
MYEKTYSNLAVAIVVASLLLPHLTITVTAFNNPSSRGENTDLSQTFSEPQLGFNSFPWNNFGIFNGGFGFSSDYGNCIVADEDSAQLVIGVDHSNPQAFNSVAEAVARNKGKIVNTVSTKDRVMAVVADIPLDKVPLFREQISKDPMVRYVEPNMKRQALLEPNDPYWINQWGPKKIEANWAWNTTLGSHGIIVAVVDTGIYWRHEDLTSNYWGRGYNWVDNNPYPDDDHGHGTHCAGIIAAVINNNKGIAGLAQV